MNCKQGDLAFIIGSESHPTCNGMIVEVVKQYDHDSWIVSGHEFDAYSMIVWGELRPVYDERLRPIRDQPGEDETLTWSGKPADQTVTISSRGE